MGDRKDSQEKVNPWLFGTVQMKVFDIYEVVDFFFLMWNKS